MFLVLCFSQQIKKKNNFSAFIILLAGLESLWYPLHRIQDVPYLVQLGKKNRSLLSANKFDFLKLHVNVPSVICGAASVIPELRHSFSVHR